MTTSIDDLSAIHEILRQRANAPTSEEVGPCVATLNLLVFIDDADYREWVLERAERMTEKHPSRLIVLDATRDDGSADVSTTRGDGCTVLSQRIMLDVGDIDPAVAASIARDLLVSDTHTVLWWSSAAVAESALLEALFPLVQTIVVDSSGPKREDAAVREVANFLRAHPGAVLRDLAYMRLLPWQDMIAQFFDDPALFHDLFSLRRLEIAAGSEAETVYLAGWLASRLSWHVGEGHTFIARDGGTVTFAPSRSGERRRVMRVALGTGASTYAATLSDDPTVVCLSVEGAKAKPCWYTPLQSVDTMSLVERATMHQERDLIFEQTVETVCGLLDCASQ